LTRGPGPATVENVLGRDRSRRIAAALIALAAVLWAGATPASAETTWVVTTAEDSNGTCTTMGCSLRAAIKAANVSADSDVIRFDIPPAGPKTISVGAGLKSGLPVITGNDIVVDATSQPGGGSHGIRLDDPDAGDGEHGLVIEGDRVTVRGFAITRFDGWGIAVWQGSAARIHGNRVGTADGVTDHGTHDDGIRLHGGGSSIVGGADPGEGNLVSGSDNDGIELRNSSDNVIVGNMVGLTADGLGRLPNAGTGIELNGTSSRNRVGGETAGERNFASGNNGIGVQLLGLMQPDGTCQTPEDNLVKGNYLGLDVLGGRMVPSGNRGEGIALHVCARRNIVGGTSAGARNIISGNAADGVELDSTGGPAGPAAVCDNVIQGNYIGLSPSGLGRRDNFDDGIGLDNGACNNLVGGSAPAARNHISGNSNDGVDISRVGSDGNVVQNNVIGLGVDGSVMHNGFYGVLIRSKPQRNVVLDNVISGNAQGGVRIQDYLSYSNEVRGNLIGTDVGGAAPRPNHGHGVWLYDGPNHTLIAGNAIMWNALAGVAVERRVGSDYSTRRNTITANRFEGNGGMGIDLIPAAGANAVDGINNDIGIGNHAIDAPVIGEATSDGFRGTAPPGSSIEVFRSRPDADETHGEGDMLVATARADAAGLWCAPTSAELGGMRVTATATDATGNTSEFAHDTGVTGEGPTCGRSTPQLLAHDDFGRVLTGGWGADLFGSPWVLSGGSYRFAVNGSEGTMLQDAPWISVHAVLSTPPLLDIDESVRFKTDKPASGAGAYFYLGHRFQDHGNYYRLEIGLGINRNVTIKWSKFVDAALTDIVPATTVVREAHEPDAWYRARLQVSGTNPTTFRAKVWRDGTLEPAAWDIGGFDAEPVLQQAGNVSLRTLVGTAFSGLPLLASWDDFVVRSLTSGS
jgi:CSLREA domain-containing protein